MSDESGRRLDRPAAVVAFLDYVGATLDGWDVLVEDVRQVSTESELVELDAIFYLPSHDRTIRNKVLVLLHDFERAHAHTVTVSPAILYVEERGTS